jgi:hypothetical protein
MQYCKAQSLIELNYNVPNKHTVRGRYLARSIIQGRRFLFIFNVYEDIHDDGTHAHTVHAMAYGRRRDKLKPEIIWEIEEAGIPFERLDFAALQMIDRIEMSKQSKLTVENLHGINKMWQCPLN